MPLSTLTRKDRIGPQQIAIIRIIGADAAPRHRPLRSRHASKSALEAASVGG